jgi:4-hydroxybenzoate polyprenyltransferase
MSQTYVAGSRVLGGKLAGIARVQDWWSIKFSPLLGTFYATAWMLGVPVWPLVPRLLLLVLALTVGATYVSVINDWTDRADDLAGGKANRLAAASGSFPALILAGCLSVGLAIGVYFWQLSPVSGLLYAGSWVAFSCYSWPPVRLKTRGLAGVLADASGSHFFPLLLTVSLVGAWSGRAVPGLWYGAVGAWALGGGVRNILLHQLGDIGADERAGVNTWVRVRGVHFTQRVGQCVAFPIEALAFGLLVVLSHTRWPIVLVAIYLLLEGFKWRLWSSRPMILEPGTRMLLSDYYEVFYPLGFLLALSSRNPVDGWLLAVHLLLFGLRFWQTVREMWWAGSVVLGKMLSHIR